MRVVYLGPPDEPEVCETIAFGRHWWKGRSVDAGDLGSVEVLARHPHFAIETDDASEAEADDEPHGFEVPPAGDEQVSPVRRRPGRPRKVAE